MYGLYRASLYNVYVAHPAVLFIVRTDTSSFAFCTLVAQPGAPSIGATHWSVRPTF